MIQSKFFDTTKTDLFGNQVNGLISSGDFAYNAQRKISEITPEQLPEAIHDFANTLKAIVKAEMLEQFKKSIENINTFYN